MESADEIKVEVLENNEVKAGVVENNGQHVAETVAKLDPTRKVGDRFRKATIPEPKLWTPDSPTLYRAR